MTPVLTSSSCTLPNLCSYSRTSQSHLWTASVVWAIDSGRFGCNKYCIRTRCRPVMLLSNVAFNARHASRPLLTSVLFTVTRSLPLCQGKIQLRIVFLATLFTQCRCRDCVLFHCSQAESFNRLGVGRSHVRGELERPLLPVLMLASEYRCLADCSNIHEWCCCCCRRTLDLFFWCPAQHAQRSQHCFDLTIASLSAGLFALWPQVLQRHTAMPSQRLEIYSFLFRHQDRYLLLSSIHSKFRCRSQFQISIVSLNPQYSTNTPITNLPITPNLVEVTNCRYRLLSVFQTTIRGSISQLVNL